MLPANCSLAQMIHYKHRYYLITDFFRRWSIYVHGTPDAYDIIRRFLKLIMVGYLINVFILEIHTKIRVEFFLKHFKQMMGGQ